MRLVPGAVYQYKGRPYLMQAIQRMHSDESLYVAYIPLYINPDWPTEGPGSVRVALRPIQEFKELFSLLAGSTPL
jgi:hypothetical protein